jgi:hypothetical protein
VADTIQQVDPACAQDVVLSTGGNAWEETTLRFAPGRRRRGLEAHRELVRPPHAIPMLAVFPEGGAPGSIGLKL